MNYYAPTKKFTNELREIENATLLLLYALRHIRQLAELPLTKYKRSGQLTHADHAQKGILDAAKELGIDLGARWGENLDLTDVQG
jgi:hypothetical protein